MKLGRLATIQIERLGAVWKQGQHVLITGATGSGKTALARHVIQQRIRRGGYVIVFVAKLQPDDVIRDDYADFVRWKDWKSKPGLHEQKVLFWPAVEGMSHEEATELLREKFKHALSELSRVGKWTIVIDEGLFTTSREGLGLGREIGLMSSLIRSAKGTLVINAQRPANLPLVVYSNASHAFIGRASERSDLQRLAELDGPNSRDLQRTIAMNGPHDFTWVQVGTLYLPEQVNLAR